MKATKEKRAAIVYLVNCLGDNSKPNWKKYKELRTAEIKRKRMRDSEKVMAIAELDDEVKRMKKTFTGLKKK